MLCDHTSQGCDLLLALAWSGLQSHVTVGVAEQTCACQRRVQRRNSPPRAWRAVYRLLMF